MVTFVSSALLSLGRHYEDNVGENFQIGNLDFEDIDYWILDFKNRISLAKTKSPAFCAFLNDISSSSASSFVSRLPRKFCFNLKDHEWLINMRLRSDLWPSGLLKHAPCLCGRSRASNFHHLVNCHQFIHFRSIIHNSIRDTCLDMFKANGFHGKIEPLLANLSDQPKVDRSRGSLVILSGNYHGFHDC
ncbi:hypothetical protein GEMRC1_000814 [Eukaryota sp. GEM-RC1]